MPLADVLGTNAQEIVACYNHSPAKTFYGLTPSRKAYDYKPDLVYMEVNPTEITLHVSVTVRTSDLASEPYIDPGKVTEQFESLCVAAREQLRLTLGRQFGDKFAAVKDRDSAYVMVTTVLGAEGKDSEDAAV
jgi:hypothetical protein